MIKKIFIWGCAHKARQYAGLTLNLKLINMEMISSSYLVEIDPDLLQTLSILFRFKD